MMRVDVQSEPVLCCMQGWSTVQGSVDCVQERARASVGLGAFEHERRSGREGVRGVRRGALRGGAQRVEERDDEEARHLHGFGRKVVFSMLYRYKGSQRRGSVRSLAFVAVRPAIIFIHIKYSELLGVAGRCAYVRRLFLLIRHG